ncbi:MAG TPA: hypothetical protein ACFCUY_16995 [Xenococcaceae cyanobacterium]
MNTLIINSSLLLITLANAPVLAHNIKIDGNVGVTFHIEPDHSPRAKEPSQAWFVLTRQGGGIIPLAECDCQLNVYNSENQIVQTPALIPLSPEQYQNVPGADIIFPNAGIYNLELTGEPLNSNNFLPFSVTYPVTVSPSAVRETQSNIADADSIPDTDTSENIALSPNNFPFSLTTALLAIGTIFAISSFWWLKSK